MNLKTFFMKFSLDSEGLYMSCFLRWPRLPLLNSMFGFRQKKHMINLCIMKIVIYILLWDFVFLHEYYYYYYISLNRGTIITARRYTSRRSDLRTVSIRSSTSEQLTIFELALRSELCCACCFFTVVTFICSTGGTLCAP